MIMLLLLLTPLSQGGPWRRIMMGIRAAKAAKKQEPKEATNIEKELAKLRVRYPKEMAEIDKLLSKKDALTAQQKLIFLAKKYEKATGEKLKTINIPKKSKQKGLLGRIIQTVT